MQKKDYPKISEILPIVKSYLSSEISEIVQQRVKAFESLRNSSEEILYSELCFCILAANTSAELGLRTQTMVGPKNFLTMERDELRNLLKSIHYRFYNVRSRFITENRWVAERLPSLVRNEKPWELREFLVENLKGIGYKEASHFMRNVGIFDFAILDKHILRMLSEESEPKKITSPSRYYEYERELIEKCSEFSLKPGILDLYLWYIATGKIIK